MKELSKEQIKERAKFLRQVLREKHNIELPHGHALEVLSKVLGYNDWNTASALAISPETKATDEKPLTAKFQTTDEAANFFLKFPKGTQLSVNEYSWIEPKSNSAEFAGNVTSVCSLTYDYEIQNETELRLELHTESEHHGPMSENGSATQTFDHTAAGRLQRRIKLDFLKSSFWNPRASAKSDHKS